MRIDTINRLVSPETAALIAMEKQIREDANKKSAARCRQLAAVFRQRGKTTDDQKAQQVWLECAMLVSQLGLNIQQSEDVKINLG